MEDVKKTAEKVIQDYGWVKGYVVPINENVLHRIRTYRNTLIGHLHYVKFHVHDIVTMQVFEIDYDLDKMEYTGRHVTLWTERFQNANVVTDVMKRLFPKDSN